MNSSGRGTVLVVGDNPTSRRLIQRLLEDQGYDVVPAQDGAQALSRFEAPPRPDLVLLDGMIAGLAHDINNSLTGIIGNAGLLVADAGLDDEQRDMAEAILACGQRISELVRKLADLRRVANGEHLSTMDMVDGGARSAQTAAA